MTTLRFQDAELQRLCGDLVMLEARYGRANARAISRRLQQLQAMTSLSDLVFLPLTSSICADGSTAVLIAETLYLVVSEDLAEPGAMVEHVLIVEGIQSVRSVGVT